MEIEVLSHWHGFQVVASSSLPKIIVARTASNVQGCRVWREYDSFIIIADVARNLHVFGCCLPAPHIPRRCKVGPFGIKPRCG